MATNQKKIFLLPGDGIGPEVVGETRKVIDWFNKKKSLDFKIDQDLIGGAAIDKHGVPITDEVFYKALESDAVIVGACGGPQYDKLEFSKKPERALLKLRKESIEVKLEEQEIVYGNKTFKFELDSFKKKCLLEGLDDIALSLKKTKNIESFENKMSQNKPWL